MSQKMTCPGCQSHTSAVLSAVMEGEPCPHCGLSASAVLEIDEVRRRQADEALKEKLTDALIRAGRAEARVTKLEAALDRVRWALDDVMESLPSRE